MISSHALRGAAGTDVGAAIIKEHQNDIYWLNLWLNGQNLKADTFQKHKAYWIGLNV